MRFTEGVLRPQALSPNRVPADKNVIHTCWPQTKRELVHGKERTGFLRWSEDLKAGERSGGDEEIARDETRRKNAELDEEIKRKDFIKAQLKGGRILISTR